MLLVDFSPELLVHIQSFLHPLDVASFRQVRSCFLWPRDSDLLTYHVKTCSRCYEASTERLVWMSGLLVVANDYNIYSHTFPLDTMTRADLERATLAPFRFISRLWKELDPGKPLEPASTRVIQPTMGSVATKHGGTNFCRVTVVPGGRFILTARERSLIDLWELGISPEATIRHMGAADVLGDAKTRGGGRLQVIQPDSSSRLLMLVQVTTTR
jgi:hypothetical protein